MNKVNWTAVVIFSIVVLFAFIVGLSLFGGWRYGGWGGWDRADGSRNDGQLGF